MSTASAAHGRIPVDANNCGELLAGDGRVFWITTPTRGMADDDDEEARRSSPAGQAARLRFQGSQGRRADRRHSKLLRCSRDGSKMAWQKDKEILIADSSKKPEPEIDEKVGAQVAAAAK